MGWIWREVKYDDDEEYFWEWEDLGDGMKPVWGRFTSPDGIKTIIKSEWTHEEVEPGKFLRKSNNVRQTIKMARGKPDEVLESKSYYTEESVTKEESKNGPRPNFPLQVEDAHDVSKPRAK